LTTATTGAARVEIDAAPLTVYQLISDITRMGDWSPECYRCEWLNGATTAAIGARFRGHNRLGKVGWHTDAIVTVADPGREFAFTTLHKEGREETLWRYELRQVGAGTEVIESYRSHERQRLKQISRQVSREGRLLLHEFGNKTDALQRRGFEVYCPRRSLRYRLKEWSFDRQGGPLSTRSTE
jgi:Polyketide cyclase / dehydrase and lipid transport